MRNLLFLMCFVPLSLMGRNTPESERPQWTDGFFKDLQSSYLEVIRASGYNYPEAKNNAVNEAIRTRGLATGSDATVSIKENDIEVSYNKNLIVKSRIVDEYIEHTSTGYTVFLLIQTAKNPTLSFDPVSITNKYPFTPRVFVPGMSQIYKGSNFKGYTIISAEVLSLGGIVAGQVMENHYMNKASSTHVGSQKQTYIDNANNWKIVRNASIATAVAIYVWNIIDGIAADGRKHVFTGSESLAVVPYADVESVGLSLSLLF